MILSYAKYIDLMSALDEHCKGSLEKRELQSAIFNHYMNKYGSFVAENFIGSKRLFLTKWQKNKYNNSVRKTFIKFMNETYERLSKNSNTIQKGCK